MLISLGMDKILDILHNLNSLPVPLPPLALLALFLSRENGSKTTLIGQGHGQGIEVMQDVYSVRKMGTTIS